MLNLLAYSNDFCSNSVKMDEVRFVLSESFEYDIIAIAETWLTESTPNNSSDLYLPNYTIFRKDRQTPNSRGGGVVFFLSYDVASGSEITPCNKICNPLVVYQFTGYVMTSITTLRT